MLRITVSGARLNYDVKLTSRYTVFTGCSASGKSFFVDVIDNPKNHPGYSVKLSDPKYVVLTSVKEFNLALTQNDNRYKKYLFVIDDDDSEFDESVYELLHNYTKSYFIFITRNERITQVNYGLYDVYEFIQVGNTDVMMPAFTYKVIPCISDRTLVISEDSGSGLSFYEKLFKSNAVMPITDVNGNVTGKDELVKMLQRLVGSADSIFVVADWCSMGDQVARLSVLLQNNKTSIYLIPSLHSFEFLLLRTNMLDVDVPDDYLLDKESQERAYEQLLEDVTRDKRYYQKHSNPLKKCYMEPCCTYPEEKMSCDKFVSGKDKFVLLLEGTEFEILLKLAGRL